MDRKILQASTSEFFSIKILKSKTFLKAKMDRRILQTLTLEVLN